MPTIYLTDLTIRSLKNGSYYDIKTRGFGIRVGKNRKTWHIVKEPSRTKITIGYYPDLSLSDARKKALILIATPIEKKQQFPTFTEARTEFLAQGKWRDNSRYQITRTLTRHFDWKKTLDKITHRDVTEAIDAIKAPSEAAHAFKDIRSFFRWCVPRYIVTSPCAGLRPPSKYVPRERVLTDEEVKKIWRAADSDHPYDITIRLLILLGQRLGETSLMNSHWLNGMTLIIPAENTKNGREHKIPLPQLAVPLIEKLMPFKGWGKKKIDFDRNLELAHWTHHDLRRTYATTMQRLGVRIEVTERLLNHASGTRGGITGIYQRHNFWPEMINAVKQYEEFLCSILA